MESLNLLIQFAKVILIIVTIHELGHFLIARATGMRAEIFAIGMGMRLFGWNKITGFTFGDLPEDWDGGDHTDYRFCLLPLGGYVKISGMVDESFDKDQMQSEPKPYEFRSKSAWRKAAVISAGVIFNFILSFLIYSGVNFSEGKDVSTITTIASVQKGSILQQSGMKIGDKILSINGTSMQSWEDVTKALTLDNFGENRTIIVQRENQNITLYADGTSLVNAMTQKKGLGIIPEGIRVVIAGIESMSPAEKAGIKTGDTILSINGKAMFGVEDFVNLVQWNKDKPLAVTWKHGSKEVSDTIIPKYDGSVNRHRIGVQTTQEYSGPTKHIDYSLAESAGLGLNQTVMNVTLFFKTITGIFQGTMSVSDSIGGPIKIAKIAGKQAEQGWTSFLLLIASLSVSIAVINILPLPALDGGHLVFIIIEGIMRREVPIKVKLIVQQIGVALLLILFLLITINDLFK
ncbi:MAG: RIP metalloprotease RseP [Ignavibacteria bacterium]|jgi:regulator of sigma E protease